MNRILVLITIISGLLAIPGFAQEDIFSGSSYNAMENLKKEIEILLEENRKLTNEYQHLQDKFFNIQKQVQEKDHNLRIQEKQITPTAKLRKQQEAALDHLSNNLADMEGQILLQRSKNNYLSTELIDIEQKQKLWELQLTDLELQKRQLQMDLKMKNFLNDESEEKQSDELNQLKKQIQADLDQQAEYERLSQEITSSVYASSEEKNRLKAEMDEIQEEIAALERKKEFKERENALLRNKRLYLIKSSEGEVQEKERLEEGLKSRVNQLEERYKQITSQVNNTLTDQSEKQAIWKNFIKLDRENQSLRSSISDLQAKIEQIKR